MATSGIYTLEDLRTLATQRANLENSQFITESEWNNYVNDSLKELYDLVIQAYGDDYFVERVSFTTDGTTDRYDLPNGTNHGGATPFYKFLGLDLAIGNSENSYVTIRNFSFQDRNRYSTPSVQAFYGPANLRYRLSGNTLWIMPTPQAGQTLRLWYIPRCVTLVSDADTTDCYGGWGEYVAIDAAIKATIKQELDATQLGGQKLMIIKRIESVAENRDAGNPACVTDATANSTRFPGGGPGFGGY